MEGRGRWLSVNVIVATIKAEKVPKDKLRESRTDFYCNVATKKFGRKTSAALTQRMWRHCGGKLLSVRSSISQMLRPEFGCVHYEWVLIFNVSTPLLGQHVEVLEALLDNGYLGNGKRGKSVSSSLSDESRRAGLCERNSVTDVWIMWTSAFRDCHGFPVQKKRSKESSVVKCAALLWHCSLRYLARLGIEPRPLGYMSGALPLSYLAMGNQFAIMVKEAMSQHV